jgi:nucleotide-binding universal stress UspA family protein
MKLLIGYDGSACGRACLDDLRRAGLPREAEAIVFTVSEIWLPHITRNNLGSESINAGSSQNSRSTASSAEPVTEARALALEGKKILQSHFPSWSIRAEDATGSPAREILRKAEGWVPDLIAVGSRGQSALGRFLLGSVSQKVVNEARCSVRVSRGTAWKSGSPVRMLVGLDGTPGSTAVIQAISTRMWPPASEARLITNVDPPTGSFGSSLHESLRKESSPAAIPVRVREAVDAATKKLQETELFVSSKVEEGDPKQLIIANAEEWGAECIFLGASQGQSPLEQFLLGSVATAVVSRAHCSVEVVRDRTGNWP